MYQFEVFFTYVYVPLVAVLLIVSFIALCISCFRELRRKIQEQNAAELAQRAAVDRLRRLVAETVEQARLAAAELAGLLAEAAAAAPVVKKELGYFPYSAVVEGGSGRAPGERQLVCAICLEVFVPGAPCSEVTACRHFFHRDCIGTWMKNSESTCPLCRALIRAGVRTSVRCGRHGLA